MGALIKIALYYQEKNVSIVSLYQLFHINTKQQLTQQASDPGTLKLPLSDSEGGGAFIHSHSHAHFFVNFTFMC